MRSGIFFMVSLGLKVRNISISQWLPWLINRNVWSTRPDCFPLIITCRIYTLHKRWFILNLEILVSFSKRKCSSNHILRVAQKSWDIIAGSSQIQSPLLLLTSYVVMVQNWHWNLSINGDLVSFRSPHHHHCECLLSVSGFHPGMFITFSPHVSPVPSDLNSSSVVIFQSWGALQSFCCVSPSVRGSDIFLMIMSGPHVWKKTTKEILYYLTVRNVWPQCDLTNGINFCNWCKARFAHISNLKTSSWLSLPALWGGSDQV